METISRRDAFRRGGAALIGGAAALIVGEIPAAKAENSAPFELWQRWHDAVIVARDAAYAAKVADEEMLKVPYRIPRGQERPEHIQKSADATIKAMETREQEERWRDCIYMQPDTSPEMQKVKNNVQRVYVRCGWPHAEPEIANLYGALIALTAQGEFI